MSGGSWDYAYSRIRDVADRLCRPGQSVERRAMGAHVQRLSVAMKAVEWLDSGDTIGDTKEIRAFLAGFGDPDKQIAAVVAADLRDLIASAGALADRLEKS